MRVRFGAMAKRASPDRRAAILDAAIAVIARRGVRGLRVEQVAAEAGVAVSLDLLLLRQSQRPGARDARARQRAGRDAHGRRRRRPPAASRPRRSLLAELDDGDAVRDTSVVWGEVLASAMFEPELRDQLREASETWTDLVAGAIREGVEDGSISGDVDAHACASA